MNVNILNLGLGANLLELCYRRRVEPYEKDYVLSIIDVPQHLVAAALASTFFSGPIAVLVFVGLPLTFKAINLCTKEGSNLNKMARAGDHLMRLTSKATIITASVASIFAVPLYSITQSWEFARTFILLVSFIEDASTTAIYAASSMTNFEAAIHMCKMT